MKLPEKKELTGRKLSFGSLLEIESIGVGEERWGEGLLAAAVGP